MRNLVIDIRANQTNFDDGKTTQRHDWLTPRLRMIEAAEAAGGGTTGDDGLGDFNS